MVLVTDLMAVVMINSLRARLLIMMVVVISVAIATVAFFASRSTSSQFQRSIQGVLDYPNFSLETRINAINKVLVTYKGERTIWDRLQTLLEGMERTARARFVLADLAGVIRADSRPEYIGSQINTELSRPFAAFLIEGEPILAYGVPLEDHSLEAIEKEFTASVNRSLLIAMALAALVALLVTLFSSRSILGPIEALIGAARALEKGNLNQRVEVHGAREISELARAFNSMAAGLQRLEQLRQNMVTDVAHELRTPLSNIRGYLEALRDGVVDPTPQTIASVHDEALLLSRLVDDLQELALAEAGQLTLIRQPVEIVAVIEKAINAVAPQAFEKGLEICVAMPEGLPQVNIDPGRTGQVLRNLLTNAITNTPPGGEISVTAQKLDSQVEVSVQDNGVGIPKEHLPYIFERFYRVDKSRTRLTGGAGLGLAIVRQLVEAQGGQVNIQSQVGVGTKVTFTAPVVLKS